jgi:hypothetical protein
VAVLPEASETESVIICAPASAQVSVRVAGRKVNVPPQLSVEPLFIWVAVTIALPEPSRVAVVFRHAATGGVVSCISTVDAAVAVQPYSSVTVTV